MGHRTLSNLSVLAGAVLALGVRSPHAAACSCRDESRIYATWHGPSDTLRAGDHLWITLDGLGDVPLDPDVAYPFPETSDAEWAGLALRLDGEPIRYTVHRRFGETLELVPAVPLPPGAELEVDFAYARQNLAAMAAAALLADPALGRALEEVVEAGGAPGDPEEGLSILAEGPGRRSGEADEGPVDEEEAPADSVEARSEASTFEVRTAEVARVRVVEGGPGTLVWTGPVSGLGLLREDEMCGGSDSDVYLTLGAVSGDALFAVWPAESDRDARAFVAEADAPGELALHGADACGGHLLPSSLRIQAFARDGTLGPSYELTFDPVAMMGADGERAEARRVPEGLPASAAAPAAASEAVADPRGEGTERVALAAAVGLAALVALGLVRSRRTRR